LSKKVQVHDIACPSSASIAGIEPRHVPYSFAHCDAGNQSSFVCRSLKFPRSGTGFGPGGRGADEALGFRNHSTRTKTKRRPAQASHIAVDIEAGEDDEEQKMQE